MNKTKSTKTYPVLGFIDAYFKNASIAELEHVVAYLQAQLKRQTSQSLSFEGDLIGMRTTDVGKHKTHISTPSVGGKV